MLHEHTQAGSAFAQKRGNAGRRQHAHTSAQTAPPTLPRGCPACCAAASCRHSEGTQPRLTITARSLPSWRRGVMSRKPCGHPGGTGGEGLRRLQAGMPVLLPSRGARAECLARQWGQGAAASAVAACWGLLHAAAAGQTGQEGRQAPAGRVLAFSVNAHAGRLRRVRRASPRAHAPGLPAWRCRRWCGCGGPQTGWLCGQRHPPLPPGGTRLALRRMKTGPAARPEGQTGGRGAKGGRHSGTACSLPSGRRLQLATHHCARLATQPHVCC